MKRRNLLLGSISAAAVAMVGKSVPEKVTITLKNGSTLTGATDNADPMRGESTSGYQIMQMLAMKGIKDQTMFDDLKDEAWYQELLRERVLREMYPPMILMRPDERLEYIDTPITAYRSPEMTAYGYIDAPYQAKRNAAMDAKFAAKDPLDAEDAEG